MQLLQIWQRILGVRNASVHDNFFDVGGHSLLAIRMIGEINKLLDVNLTVPTFFLSPTVEGLARVIEQAKNTKATLELIPLKPARSEGNLFFLEASIGLCRLAELLDSGPASYAAIVPMPSTVLKAAVENRMADLPPLETLAAPYAAMIARQQQSGPCVLVGHSFGGLLAFEVAHQLRGYGRKVEMIVLLDTLLLPSLWQRIKKFNYARARWALNWRMQHLKTAIADKALAPFSGSRHTRNSTPAGSAPVHLYRPFGLASVPWEFLRKVYQKAANPYRLRLLEGRGVLIRARDANRYVHFADMGWGGLFTDGLEIIDAPGDHLSLLEHPNILDLAQGLQKCLATLIKY